MIILFFLSFFIIFLYLLLIGWISNRWEEIEETTIPKSYSPAFNYSILIPFRDDEAALSDCLKSLYNLNPKSPNREVICINDGDSPINYYPDIPTNVTFIKSNGGGKKSALTTGIVVAQHEFIITIDADCTVHPDWLMLIDEAIQQKEVDVLTGAVIPLEEETLLSRFQYLDFVGTMAVNAAGIHSKQFYICSGANFCYKKSLFDEVQGYTGNEHIASGDDVFLLNKFSKNHNSKIGFLKSRRGAVITKNESTWHAFTKQRIRWASKSKSYANSRILGLQGYVFLVNLWLLCCIIVFPFVWGSFALITGVFGWFLKWIIDYLFLNRMVQFFGGQKVMKSFISASALYTIYIIAMAVVAMIPVKTNWKGRRV